jgi:hypothetical protein
MHYCFAPHSGQNFVPGGSIAPQPTHLGAA